MRIPVSRLSALFLTLVLPLSFPGGLQAAPSAASSPIAPQSKKKKSAEPSGPTDEDVRAAWKKLGPDERGELIEFFSAECERLPTFQSGLIAYLMRNQDRPATLWPDAPENPPLFDASVHAPAQPIQRKFKSQSSAKRFAKKVFEDVPERRLKSAWSYDYGSRELWRLPDHDDLERVFENGLAGFEPRHDYCEALVERMLDDGSLQTTMQAFGHAYADRVGNAYPGITLYDVWSAGIEMEMPDVECLGIVHMVDDDWKTWTAPVSKQDSLYERIGEHFSDARRHRGLRNALARVFLAGAPVVRDGYESNVDRFHAMWEQVASDPVALAKGLPQAKDWLDWLESKGREVDTSQELYLGGQRRKQTLANDGWAVRGTMIYVMREFGALPRD